MPGLEEKNINQSLELQKNFLGFKTAFFKGKKNL